MPEPRFTERLRLVPIGPQLADDLYELHTDEGIAEWYGVWTPDDARKHAAIFGAGWEKVGVSKWLAYDRVTGELIGRGGLSRITLEGAPVTELGWALRRKLWGRGYATEIGNAGLDLAFDELDDDEVVAFTERRNTRSWRVMERLGMTYVRDLTYEDEPFVLYAMARSTRRSESGSYPPTSPG
jgi:ribosomal-protein-alanine N-acetyltransferase